MVFEHLDEPEVQLKEINRILKPGGKLIFHTPNALSYSTLGARLIPERVKERVVGLLQGRKKEDVFPTFYKINSRAKIEKLGQECGLQIRKIKMICSSAQFIMIPLIAILELLWIRVLMTEAMRSHRTNIIAILEKASYEERACSTL
jgi:SAM-dependent methyltransferase